ncbi:MAG: TetR/AcrR family transcriptional regulator [Actinomycetota bacterium]|jgi:AcrR family transcriptional regulator
MSTRDRIVAAAAQLYGRYGYTGVGLKQVAAESGAPIGSLYHFFPGGKDELAAEALRMSGAGYQTLVEGVLENMPDIPAGIEQSFALAAENLAATGYVDACWIETVALEVASTNEPLRLVTAEIFERWTDSATAWCESHGLPPDEARELGIAYITGLEGAFILARSLRSPEPLLATGRRLAAAAREALAAARRPSAAAGRRPARAKGARK